MKHNIKTILEKQKEGEYTAFVPSLPGCISQDETKQDTIKNIKEVLSFYLES